MGLRKPSGWQTFTAQALSGASRQKKARDEMKDPNKTKQALGGSASTGTEMVAATTGAQQAATKQVQSATTQASKDLAVDQSKLGTATTTAMTQGVKDAGGGFTQAQQMATHGRDLGGSVVDGDVSTVQTAVDKINTDIKTIEDQIADLDNRIKNATAQDAQKLQAEKDRLTEQLEIYNKKISEENLGKIAGTSTFEEDMLQREQLLASEGQRAAKLASIFGPGWNTKRYGALASQIYGKDLEAIEEAAGAGLSAREKAQRQAAAAEEEYGAQIDKSKEEFEKSLENEDRKVELLGLDNEGLRGVTEKEIRELFGDKADSLFTFKDGYVSGGKLTKTREILDKNLKLRKEDKDIADKALEDAQKNKTKREKDIVDGLFGVIAEDGTVQSKGAIETISIGTRDVDRNINRLLTNIEQTKNSYFAREWSGISRDHAILKNLAAKSSELVRRQNDYKRQLETARDNKDYTKMTELAKQMRENYQRVTKEIEADWGKLTDTIRRK